MTIEQYIDKVNTRFKTGISTEHSYRADLQNLLEALCPDILVTNEPARVACGAPDYILTSKGIPVGYIEAKDLGASLTDKTYKEQFDRYKASLNNLIFTDYLDFHLYRDGVFVASVAIGKIENGKLIPDPSRYKEFENIIKDFATHVSQTIRSAEKLSRMMAAKARMLATVIENAVTADEDNKNELHEDANNSLRQQLAAFKEILIHDITPKEFADIYAQTIAYGMFAARLHDPSMQTFTRMEAAELIPKSNPFLRKLFQYIAGYDLDNRIKWIVDALADIFRATDVAAMLQNFGKATQQQDPIIHFYETFLGEYDPKLRKARGVWYTPEPVVNFIVRAVDDILKTEFGLKDGLADTSKTKVKIKVANKATADNRSKTKETEIEQEVHKVQILDPATGTGTFLAEIIKHIHKKFQGQQGIWSKYVDDHLIPRLNGFEILMASYAMAHLKLDLLLTETGYKASKEQRFKVFLTNSLEEYHPDTGTLFANWLSTEANEANKVKRDTPVMVVLGNPPYSIVSSNLSPSQRELVDKYKYVDGKRISEKGALQLEKNLNDDYVKFIALSESFINKNGEGVLAFINNNNFLDALTLRGMRWNLLNSFDKLYILDLHGNAMKKEVGLKGEKDENVFDIQQGVSINIFIKTGKKKQKELGKIFHFDLFGKREQKYQYLFSNSLMCTGFEQLSLIEPHYYLVKKDFEISKSYYIGIEIDKLFKENVTGVKTHRDSLVIGLTKPEIAKRIQEFYNKEYKIETTKRNLGLKDTGTWNSSEARDKGRFDEKHFKMIQYRPFDTQHIYYDGNLIDCTRINVMKHFINSKNNIGLVIPRQAITDNWSHVQVTNSMVDNRIHYSNKGTPICCPLYLYPELSTQQSLDGNLQRQPNLNKEIVEKIAAGIGLKFTAEKESTPGTFAPIDILDYIYAVLHSPAYLEKYKEFLKIDFPRVPYPKSKEIFWQLVKLGGQLREIHLLESPVVEKYITQYPIDGSNEVEKLQFVIPTKEESSGNVYINDTQYFANVPQEAWNFYIGGYQPAQKWLKDRKGRTLTFEDILHYQKIIVALSETDKLMKEIDKIEIE